MNIWEIFTESLRATPASPLLRAIDFPHEFEVSPAMEYSSIQDPLRFRSRFVALEIARALVDDQGNFKLDFAAELKKDLEQKQYLIGPQLENDAFIFEHLHRSIAFLIENKEVQKIFQKIALPLCHRGAERTVRDTLWPYSIKKLHVADVKKAILAAWFTWLRQVTGSCFATAPAILIQQEQPLQFIQDLFDLLTFGVLRRVVSGQEYSVPLCPSHEQFDLTRPIGNIPADRLAQSPGLRACFPADAALKELIENEDEAKTPKELIERIFLRLLDLEASDIQAEEELKRLEMPLLLAKESAIYYRRPTDRAQKVSQWKELVEKGSAAFQALTNSALLRAWEATIASFSDAKLDLAKWNLYVSLGLHPDYAGGVGSFLQSTVKQKEEVLKRKFMDLQEEYERIEQYARNAERMQRRADFTSAMGQGNSLRRQIQDVVLEAEQLSDVFSILIEEYARAIPESFQEIFDPALAKNSMEMVDDSPAGFRLVYKHGKNAQWTYIHNAGEFIHSLREFFEYCEREASTKYPAYRNWIEELSTALIQAVQTAEFLNLAMDRVRKNPAIHDARAKPWEYISGGTMTSLLMTYYNRQASFSSLQKIIQNEHDLLAFLIDSASMSKKKVLIHSPSHAFIFRPDWMPSKPMQAVEQMQKFWREIKVDAPELVAEKVSLRLSPELRPLFLHRWRQTSSSENLLLFRNSLLESLDASQEALIDSVLYESLPLIPIEKAIDLAADSALFPDQPWITSFDLREILQAIFIKEARTPFSDQDIDEKIAAFMREKKIAPPKPILFADTNWTAGFFGLAVSPTGRLDLWRFNRTGTSGVPMQRWFSQQCDDAWVILHHPEEYTPRP